MRKTNFSLASGVKLDEKVFYLGHFYTAVFFLKDNIYSFVFKINFTCYFMNLIFLECLFYVRYFSGHEKSEVYKAVKTPRGVSFLFFFFLRWER